ncbi:hypothetical protein [Roseococcus sp.]|uniref:hypothetical protein n=1 Tax=Roseococcus sp. TaxID=2109646 RepID=UPI003BAB9204
MRTVGISVSLDGRCRVRLWGLGAGLIARTVVPQDGGDDRASRSDDGIRAQGRMHEQGDLHLRAGGIVSGSCDHDVVAGSKPKIKIIIQISAVSIDAININGVFYCIGYALDAKRLGKAITWKSGIHGRMLSSPRPGSCTTTPICRPGLPASARRGLWCPWGEHARSGRLWEGRAVRQAKREREDLMDFRCKARPASHALAPLKRIAE